MRWRSPSPARLPPRSPRSAGSVSELVRVKTEGDINTGPLAAIGGTGIFVTAVRAALADGRVDVIVHSFKDLPTAPAPGLSLAAVPTRENPFDALCARDGLTLDTLPSGARIGTGSPRRVAQLLRRRPDLRVEPVRGNVDTRLRLVSDGDLDAVVLAVAGLTRLDRTGAITETFGPDVMLPAPAQGALAVECRAAELETAWYAGRVGSRSTAARHGPRRSPNAACWRRWRPVASHPSVRTPPSPTGR